MKETRIIKKYPNRRLYDMTTSAYITLEDIKKMVIDHIPIKIIDAKSEEDITNSALLQIILEQEARGFPLLSTEILQNIIRFSQYSPVSFMNEMTQKNMTLWKGFEENWTQIFKGKTPS